MVSILNHLSFLVLFLFFLSVNVQSNHSLRILGLFPFQGRSHYNMAEKLLKALAMKGHQVDVYNHFPQKTPVPNFTDYSLVGGIYENKDNVTYDDLLKYMEGTTSIRYWLDLTGKPVCDQMSLPIFQNLLHNPPQDPPYDIIISDVVMSGCYIAWSYHLNVPMIDMVTSLSYDWINKPRGNPTDYVTEPSVFSNIILPTSFLERLYNYYMGVSIELSFGWFIREQDELVKKYFGNDYPSVWDMYKDLALIFVNYQHAVHGPRAFVPSIVPVGGLHIEDTNVTLRQDLQTWLDESKDGFIYFSFGSMVRSDTFPKYILEAFYEAFESIAPVRVLWKVVNPALLPPNLPKNVKTEKWLPQTHILKHKNIKAFMTHGGLMSTYETIYHAVPTICFPFYGDQPLNSDMFVTRKAGIKVKLTEVTAKVLKKALNQILDNPEYKQNAIKLSNNLKDLPMSPMDTAIFWTEYIALHGKNALRMPIVDMPWWQAYHLDIYSFIAVVLALISYITKVIIKVVVRLMLTTFNYLLVHKIKQN